MMFQQLYGACSRCYRSLDQIHYQPVDSINSGIVDQLYLITTFDLKSILVVQRVNHLKRYVHRRHDEYRILKIPHEMYYGSDEESMF
jgi:hypothetical protein